MTSPSPGAAPTSAFRCSVAAERRGDSQVGTAPPARRWLLIEHRGPWAFAAVASSGIDPLVLAELQQAADRAAARILLIRRPGRREATGARSWAVVSHEGAAVWGTWSADDQLRTAVEALGMPPASGQADPVLLVCAHGLHDPCCAVRGRPVAAALQQQWPEWTWECSHVGGDRFAPNVVVLPDGAYYGGVGVLDAVTTIRAHLEGAVQAQHLRGLSTMSPPAQAAVVAAHARYGPAGARQISVAEVHRVGDHRFAVAIRGSGTVPAQLHAVVRARRLPDALLTCRASAETSSLDYVVETLEPLL
ncbi:MAG TPA: sucrase ferredoxin [Propionibacteriaceae bacterium]|nr:sucrase ferredoxin [Propionibacteriaceae bacterium]